MNSSESIQLTMPYPGLRPFEESDHLLFFGRNEQSNELLLKMENTAFVAVVGSSGSGKSSLVKAGLLPLVRDGFLLGREDWLVTVSRPEHQPYHRLAEKLAVESDSVSVDSIVQLLRQSDQGLLKVLNQILGDSRRPALIVIDQFEELFGFRKTQADESQQRNYASRDEAAAFVSMLLNTAQQAGRRIRILITMRSDFVGDCEVFLGLPQAVSESQFLVPRLTRRQMEEAIQGPGRVQTSAISYTPFTFEDGLVTTLINEAGDRPDQLPLLQHALMRTWKNATSRRSSLLTITDYNDAGRIHKALSNDADCAYGSLTTEQQGVARKLFLLLSDVSAEGQITRRRPLVQEVMEVAQTSCEQIEAIVKAFQEDDRSFLLPPSRGKAQWLMPETPLDISHESLLRQWSSFQTWLKSEHDAIQILSLLKDAVRTGETQLSNRMLARAIEWRDNFGPTDLWASRYATRNREEKSVSLQDCRELIQTSEKQKKEKEDNERRVHAELLEAEKQKSAAIRKWLTAVGCLALVMVVLSVAAWRAMNWAKSSEKNAVAERKKAERETTRAINSEKAAELATDRAEEMLETADRMLYASQLQSAARLAGTTEFAKTLDACRWDLRGLEHRNLVSHPSTLNGHSDNVRSASFSPDGQRIVSGSDDNSIKVWDATTGAELKTLNGHTELVSSVSFSPDGQRIVSGSFDNSIKLWNVTTGAELKTLNGHTDRVSSVKFSPDGQRIVSGSYDKSIKVWDAKTGAELRTLNGHSSYVLSVSFSSVGLKIASGSYDKSIKVWDATTGAELTTLDRHTDRISSVSFSPDGQRIVSGSYDKSIKVWDATTGAEVRTLNGHVSYVLSVSFSPDGQKIVSGGSDNSIIVWDATTGAEQTTLSGNADIVSSVSFSPDGQKIVSGSFDNSVKLWNATTGSELRTLNKHAKRVTSVSFSPDGQRIVGGSYDTSIKVWDATTGAELRTLNGHTGGVSSVSFSPDGQRIVSGSEDKSIKVWDATTGAELRTLNGHTNSVTSVSFSPDGHRILSGSEDRTVRQWFGDRPRMMLPAQLTMRSVERAAVSKDSQWLLAATEDGALAIVSSKTGKTELKEIVSENPLISLATNSKTTLVAVGSSSGKIVLQRLTQGRYRPTPADKAVTFISNSDEQPWAMAFSPDDDQLAVGMNNGWVRLWDPATAREISSIKAHDSFVKEIEFSAEKGRRQLVTAGWTKTAFPQQTGFEIKVHELLPGSKPRSICVEKGQWSAGFARHGRWIASASNADQDLDGDSQNEGAWIKVWDFETGKLLCAVKNAHTKDIHDIAFSPDGTLLGTASLDGLGKIWTVTENGSGDVVIEQAIELPEHFQPLTSIAFSHGGARAVTSGKDGYLRVWLLEHLMPEHFKAHPIQKPEVSPVSSMPNSALAKPATDQKPENSSPVVAVEPQADASHQGAAASGSSVSPTTKQKSDHRMLQAGLLVIVVMSLGIMMRGRSRNNNGSEQNYSTTA